MIETLALGWISCEECQVKLCEFCEGIADSDGTGGIWKNEESAAFTGVN
jgi:hypothetical protein